LLPIAVTASGIVTLVRLEHPLNALSGITVLGAENVTLVRRLSDNILLLSMFVTVEGTANVVLAGG
jgi:hypothetical protein